MRLALRTMGAAAPEWQGTRLVDIVETGDLAAPSGLDEAFTGVDTVVHLAGLAHAQGEAETAFYRANDEATSVLVAAAHRHGVRRFIHVGSVAALCGHSTSRIVGDQAGPAPVTAYGRSKYAAEAHVSALGRKGGVLAVTLRPPLVVAADAPGNWRRLQRLADSAMPLPATAHNRRSYVSIATLVDAIAHLSVVAPDPARSGAYCIADDEALSLRDVIAELRDGMARAPRTMNMPSGAWRALRALPPLRRTVDSLAGDLVIDPSRFFATFGLEPAGLREQIRRSGAAFSGRRNAP